MLLPPSRPASFKKKHSVLRMLSELFKKYFNPRSFRSSIAPLELYDYLNEKRHKTGFPFQTPLEFVFMCVHLVQRELAKKRRRHQKRLARRLAPGPGTGPGKRAQPDSDEPSQSTSELLTELFTGQIQVLISDTSTTSNADFSPGTSEVKNFFWLSLELPETPLVRSSNKLQTVSVADLLDRCFNRIRSEFNVRLDRTLSFEKRLTKLPRILFLKLDRFAKIENVWEKNNTIVLFDPRELKVRVKSARGAKSTGAEEAEHEARYRLIGNIIHEGSYENGNFKIQIFKEEWNEWFEVSEGLVREISEDRVKCSETIIQIYSRLTA